MLPILVIWEVSAKLPSHVLDVTNAITPLSSSFFFMKKKDEKLKNLFK